MYRRGFSEVLEIRVAESSAILFGNKSKRGRTEDSISRIHKVTHTSQCK